MQGCLSLSCPSTLPRWWSFHGKLCGGARWIPRALKSSPFKTAIPIHCEWSEWGGWWIWVWESRQTGVLALLKSSWVGIIIKVIWAEKSQNRSFFWLLMAFVFNHRATLCGWDSPNWFLDANCSSRQERTRTARCWRCTQRAARGAFPYPLSLLTLALLKEKKIEHKKLKVVHTVVSIAICVTLTLLRKSNYPLASGDLN